MHQQKARHIRAILRQIRAERSRLDLEFLRRWPTERIKAYRGEAKSYYRKLVESYPGSEWSQRASDRLITMGLEGAKEELDS